MIPQRVSIEGFMSYRERVEFFFDGAPVWMLTGKNGAGKSTVFDAITFALYGEHRGPKDNVEELINRRSDSLAVEFDFQIGDDCYRVRRTVPRVGKPTYQATHLSGPNSPQPAARSSTSASPAQPVPGTHTKSGLTEWVKRCLGLDDKAFKMSVLLEQGKSEALLSAKPVERHDLLTQLVDLSRYQALAERAKRRKDEARAVVQRNKAELQTLPRVTDEEIGAEEGRLNTAKAQVKGSQQRVEQLQGLMVHAQNWGKWYYQRDEVCNTLAGMKMLLADAPNIEDAAAHYEELCVNLPLMRRIFGHSNSHAEHRRKAEIQRENALRYAALCDELTPQVEAGRLAVERWQQAREEAQAAQSAALQQLNDLSTARHDISELARLGERIAACDGQLAQFSADLDHQATAAREEVDTLHALNSLLPYLDQYVNGRDSWHSSTTQLEAARRELAVYAEQVAAARARVEQAHAAVKGAHAALLTVKSQAAVAQNHLAMIEEQIGRFGEVDALPTCLYCGQPLSSEHLEAERSRLQRAQASCTSAAYAADRAAAEAHEFLAAAEAEFTRCQSAYDQAHKQQGLCQERCQSLDRERSRAERDGGQALLNARAKNAPAALLPQAVELLAAFAEAVPAPDQLLSLKGRVSGLAAAQTNQASLQARVTERERHRSSRQQLNVQYAPLAKMYSEARRQEIHASHAAAEQARERARTALAQTGVELDKSKAEMDSLATRLQRAQGDLQQAEQQARTDEQLALAALAHRDQEAAALSPAWRARAAQVSESQLAQWDAEFSSLHGADERLEKLTQARSQIALVEARLAEIEGDLERVPPEARQPVESLQQQAAQARDEQAAGEAARERSGTALRVLQGRRERISELLRATLAEEKREAHYTTLAKYLGRDYLQRYLLQQAEREIVERANEVLDQCSGGMLAMELRPNDDVGGLQKAFDLMVENRATQTPQDKMLPAWLLSGSQRFRVAISLALGIGQFAGAKGQGIQSVIIDEGFGSLDRQGLRDMEEALRDLSDKLALHRIILVSHQDEFAKSFPHRYAITLEEGASRAELVDGFDAL